MKKKNYQSLSRLLNAIDNCKASKNTEWEDKHGESVDTIMDNAPSGSGIDCGTKLIWEESTSEKLVFVVEYHHMNDNGMYDGWTKHKITVRPSLQFDFTLKNIRSR